MTLNVQYSWQDYLTDGVQTIFPYPFYVKDKQDLAAYWEQAGTPPWHPGQPITAPLPSAFYTLTGLGTPSGGTLVTQTPLPPGRLVLRRGTPQNQLTDYLEGDAFPAESHETALDRLTVLVQDHEEVLSRASLLRVETGTPHRGLTLPDPQPNTLLGWDSTAAQWTLYPSGITSIPVDPVSGIGWGKNTIAITPVAGSAQGTGLLFPAGVLAVAVTVWIETTFGLTQGLQQVGLGTTDQPDCWGLLSALSAESTTTAGLFQGYSGQPQLSGGQVALTAYGGRFDGTGTAYVTGHFMTFGPAHEAGYSYHPGSPEDAVPFVPASETQAGLVELNTPEETVTGTDTTRATHAAGVKAALDAALAPVIAVNTTQTSQLTALQTKVPDGTALSVVRYDAAGTALQASPSVVVDAANRLGVGTTTPTYLVDVQGGDLRLYNGLVRHQRDGASANHIQETFATGAAFSSTLTTGRGGGTLLSPTAAPLGATLFGLTVRGHDGTTQQNGATLSFAATGQFSATDRGTTVTWATCASGSTTLTQRLSIDAQGDLALHGRSSVQDRPQALLAHAFVNGTDATRTSRLTLSVYDATAAREGVRLETSGTAAMLGFYGGAAVVKPTVTGAKGGNAALTSLLGALSSLGLVTDSST